MVHVLHARGVLVAFATVLTLSNLFYPSILLMEGTAIKLRPKGQLEAFLDPA